MSTLPTSRGILLSVRVGLFVVLLGGLFWWFHFSPPVVAQSSFAGGSGTVEDPYLIATAAQLDDVRNHPGAHFRLMADINLGVAPYSEGEGWVPIGSSGSPFTGSFDGDSYVIFNLTIDRPATNYQGLFGYLSGATVENVYLENISVQGDQDTGGLAGRANNSTIEHVHVTGEINGVQDTGGLVGYLAGGSNVAHASSEVVVQGGECTSGLVGYVDNADDTIYHAYTLGTVDGGLYTGGLVGRLYRGTLADSYSRATVSGSSYVGGAVGYVNLSTSYVYRTYSTGAVAATTPTYLGGLVGRSSGTVADSYWDIESSGLATSAGGTGKTTAEMQQQATFVNYNFFTLWQIDEGNAAPVFQELSAYPQPQAVDLADLTGDGTPGNPYRITSADELNAMRQALTATFQLANDIDLAATVAWDAGRGWLPIGDATNRFTGTLDGDGHTLFNLTVNRPTASYQGLFGYLDGATVQNVSLENV
ncbi:MAG: ZmpA/ZmpB/ZmpC family metallo-endopeptidase-related protein, partial [Anaerolineae bacterium]